MFNIILLPRLNRDTNIEVLFLDLLRDELNSNSVSTRLLLQHCEEQFNRSVKSFIVEMAPSDTGEKAAK